MPLMQQILLAIRMLTEDEPPQQHCRKRHGRQRHDSKRQQAVNLVITFRELFSSGGFNFLIDEDNLNRCLNKKHRQNHSYRRESITNTSNSDTCQLEYSKTCVVDLPEKGGDLSDLATSITETIPKEQKCIISTELAMPATACSNLVPEVQNRELDIRTKRNSNADSCAGTRELVLFNTRTDTEAAIASTELVMPATVCSNLVPEVQNRELDIIMKRNSNADSCAGTRELVLFNRRTDKKRHQPAMSATVCPDLVPEVQNRELDIRMKRNSNAYSCAGTRELVLFNRRTDKKRHQPVTMPLSSDDENKTVAALRKVLKWSPTKQNLATFAVSVPKEEEHKVVAVMQNAVNRVKEEQQKKKKRRLFKLTFC